MSGCVWAGFLGKRGFGQSLTLSPRAPFPSCPPGGSLTPWLPVCSSPHCVAPPPKDAINPQSARIPKFPSHPIAPPRSDLPIPHYSQPCPAACLHRVSPSPGRTRATKTSSPFPIPNAHFSSRNSHPRLISEHRLRILPAPSPPSCPSPCPCVASALYFQPTPTHATHQPTGGELTLCRAATAGRSSLARPLGAPV